MKLSGDERVALFTEVLADNVDDTKPLAERIVGLENILAVYTAKLADHLNMDKEDIQGLYGVVITMFAIGYEFRLKEVDKEISKHMKEGRG